MPASALKKKSTRLNSSHLVISYAVFCLKKNKQLITLHQFTGADGASPNSLIQARDRTLYGTTQQGGNTACPSGCGTVFHIDAPGHFSTLYAFSGPDGQYPANLLQGHDGTLY